MTDLQIQSLAALAEASEKVQAEPVAGLVVLVFTPKGDRQDIWIGTRWAFGFEFAILGAVGWMLRLLQEHWCHRATKDEPPGATGKAEFKN